MTERSQRLLTEVLALPEHDRAELASEVIASLDGPPDSDAEEAWAEEIRRRLALHEADPSRGDEWAVVKARIEEKLWPKKSEG